MNLPIPLRLVNGLAALLFAAFAWVQANDIDPKIYDHPSTIDAALWLLFYAFIAVLFALTIFKRLPAWILLVAVIACAIQMTRTVPGLWTNLFGDKPFTMVQHSMSAGDPRVELTREFFGALIALGAVGVLWWERRKSAPRSSSPVRSN